VFSGSGNGARWHGQGYYWSFPSGATLAFGFLDTENDKFNHKGAEYQFIGFDELTEHSRSSYEYLFSRLRKADGLPVPLRMRATSNPGGPGHAWVKEKFITGAKQRGSIFVKEDDGEVRLFIPSRLGDNSSLDEAQYRRGLSRLDHITRRQLEDGDWDVTREGLLFRVVRDRPRGSGGLRVVPVLGLGGDEERRQQRSLLHGGGAARTSRVSAPTPTSPATTADSTSSMCPSHGHRSWSEGSRRRDSPTACK